jgi:hypothetical protein
MEGMVIFNFTSSLFDQSFSHFRHFPFKEILF